MQALQFLQRANNDHFPPDANLWDVNLIFNLEKEIIDREIEKRAGGNWRRLNNEDDAIAQSDAIIKQIASSYDPPDEEPDPRIYDEARSGKLQLMSPTVKMITTMRIAFLVAVLAELSVLVLQAVFTGDFNPFIIVLGIFLALGGFLQGMGIGNLLTRNWKIQAGRIQRGESLAVSWLLIGIGSALILLISALRASGSSGTSYFLLVFLVTLFFGEAVAICEAIKVRYSSIRSVLLQEIALAQYWQANLSHHQHIVRGDYKAHYEAAVKRAASELAQLNQGAPRTRVDDRESEDAVASIQS
jgi:hypothetical protein